MPEIKNAFEKYNASLALEHRYSISFCPICSGAKSVYNFETEKEEYDAELAFKLAQSKFEASQSLACLKPKICKCSERIAHIAGELAKFDIKINLDSGWILVFSKNAYKIYQRYIVFNNNLSSDVLSLYKEYLKYDKCPGWTGVTCNYLFDNSAVLFQTTWDSSD